MRRYKVEAGVTGLLLCEEKPGEVQEPVPFTTRKESVFSIREILIDPEGKAGLHGPFSPTIGGDYARKGYYAFQRPGHPAILLVLGRYVEILA